MSSKLTCVILAGGCGKRLSSVVNEVPKPMAPVAGRPFLEYLLAQVRDAGCTDVVLCVGHKANVIKDYFGSGHKCGVKIRYSQERELLGTAGALALARPLIHSNPFLVLNGDSYCSVDFQGFLTQHQARGAVATIVVARVEDASRYGSIVLGEDDTVIHFYEKRQPHDATYVNAGIYILNHEVLDLVPLGKYCSIEHEVFPILVQHGLYAFRQPGPFIDIGTPDSFAMAQTVLPESLCRLPQCGRQNTDEEPFRTEKSVIREQITECLRQGAKVRLATIDKNVDELVHAAELITTSLYRAGKLLLFGNGGSAADAQHLAAEFVGRFAQERGPLPALALTTDTSALTAIANDFGFEQVFARQIRALGRSGDVAIAISTSGNSPNVLLGVQAAREMGITTIGLTGGDGGKLAGIVGCAIVVPSDNTAHIQETHIAIGHVLCGVIEQALVETPLLIERDLGAHP